MIPLLLAATGLGMFLAAILVELRFPYVIPDWFWRTYLFLAIATYSAGVFWGLCLLVSRLLGAS